MKIEASVYTPIFSGYNTSSPDKTSGKDVPARSQDSASILKTDALARQREDDLQKVQNLQNIQQTVYTHELEHKEAGPDVTGPITYRYKRGPDGRVYAVGGDTSVNISFSGNAKQTIEKMTEVEKAATAPANPSFEDFVILAHAIAYKQQAIEMQAIQNANVSESSKSTPISVYA